MPIPVTILTATRSPHLSDTDVVCGEQQVSTIRAGRIQTDGALLRAGSSSSEPAGPSSSCRPAPNLLPIADGRRTRGRRS